MAYPLGRSGWECLRCGLRPGDSKRHSYSRPHPYRTPVAGSFFDPAAVRGLMNDSLEGGQGADMGVRRASVRLGDAGSEGECIGRAGAEIGLDVTSPQDLGATIGLPFVGTPAYCWCSGGA